MADQADKRIADFHPEDITPAEVERAKKILEKARAVSAENTADFEGAKTDHSQAIEGNQANTTASSPKGLESTGHVLKQSEASEARVTTAQSQLQRFLRILGHDETIDYKKLEKNGDISEVRKLQNSANELSSSIDSETR